MRRGSIVALVCLVALSLTGIAASCEFHVGTTKGPGKPWAGTPVATPVPAEGIKGFASFAPAGGRYRIAYPDDWQAQEGAIKVGGITGDVFVGGKPDDGFNTNVNVVCEPLPQQFSSQRYLELNLDSLRSQFKVDPKVGEEVTVAGEPVKLVTYDSALGGRTYEVTQVYVARGECGWVLTLSTASGRRDHYLPAFATMYGSFAPE